LSRDGRFQFTNKKGGGSDRLVGKKRKRTNGSAEGGGPVHGKTRKRGGSRMALEGGGKKRNFVLKPNGKISFEKEKKKEQKFANSQRRVGGSHRERGGNDSNDFSKERERKREKADSRGRHVPPPYRGYNL